MAVFLYKFFHRESNDRTEQGQIALTSDETKWPESWKTIDQKSYRILPSHTLPPPPHDSWFTRLLARRRSHRDSILSQQVSFSDVAYMLACGNAVTGEDQKRTSPSAGSRYPLEIYVILFTPLLPLSPGVYHYASLSNLLETVRTGELSRRECTELAHDPSFGGTHGAIFLSCVFDRTTRKYGSAGYRYALLEAGHIAQNMILGATERGLTLIPVGGIREDVVESLLGLSTQDEQVIYGLYF